MINLLPLKNKMFKNEESNKFSRFSFNINCIIKLLKTEY